MSELVDLAAELVSIPSHEDAVAAGDAIEQWLRAETDATVRRDEVGNVFARKGSGACSLALVGHHDVVSPADRQQVEGADTYVVDVRDGRLYGRGSADMKGSLAAALLAFRQATPPNELVFASFVGEERGGVGARHAIENGFAPERAVVLEGSTGYSSPGVVDVAVAHKGRRGATVAASGTSAHASTPDAGENAIYRACDAVDRLRSLDVPAVDIADNTVSGSLVVTGIEGGTAWNVIPDECRVTVDERTVPGERVPIERVETIDCVSVRIDQDLPPMRCDDDAFATAALDAAVAVQSCAPERVVKPHATDAGWLAQAGTSCVVCGAAEPGEAHTDDESVSLDVLKRCREIYRRLAGEPLPVDVE